MGSDEKDGIIVARQIFLPEHVDGRNKKSVRALSELVQILEIFLRGCNEECDNTQLKKTIDKMLIGTKIEKNIFLTFSFPGNIRRKMLLRRSYDVRLSPGHPTIYILPELAKHLSLCNCTIKVSGFEPQKIQITRKRMKKFLLRVMPGRVKAVKLSYRKRKYSSRIKFFCKEDIVLRDYDGLQELLRDMGKFLR